MSDGAAATAIRIGISSCLLGREVRFDGGHKRDGFINQVLSGYFELVPFCPEVDIGLGVPRDPIRLERRGGAVRVVCIKQPDLDVTEPLREYGRRVVHGNPDISGYILKSRSPSCGMEQVKVYDPDGGIPSVDGVGEFARILMEQWPELPVEEEGRLNDPVLRENFIERVFTYHGAHGGAAQTGQPEQPYLTTNRARAPASGIPVSMSGTARVPEHAPRVRTRRAYW